MNRRRVLQLIPLTLLATCADEEDAGGLTVGFSNRHSCLARYG